MPLVQLLLSTNREFCSLLINNKAEMEVEFIWKQKQSLFFLQDFLHNIAVDTQ